MFTPSKKFLEEHFGCPICLDVLQNPITTYCGHNFCQSCLNNNKFSCPICRQMSPGNLSINYQLKNTIEVMKQINKNDDDKNNENLYKSENKISNKFKLPNPSAFSERSNKYRIKRIFRDMIKYNEMEDDKINFSTSIEKAYHEKELNLSTPKGVNTFLDNLMNEFRGN